MANHVGQQVKISHVVALPQEGDLVGQAQSAAFFFQLLQKSFLTGLCAANDDAVTVRPLAYDSGHGFHEMQLAFPAGNPAGHHDDLLASKLWKTRDRKSVV